MSQSTTRSILRWLHIVLAIPILGYIYSPFDKLPDYAFKTRVIFVPIMVLSGLWMWKGHVVRRLFRRDRPDNLRGSSLRPLPLRALNRQGS
jgi:hypothetical protein